MDRSRARRWILKSGYTFLRVRTPDSGGQLALAVTPEEADAIITLRREAGYGDAERPVVSSYGSFYLIQLVPELDPRRAKFGSAQDVQDRLNQHRTAAPTARVVKSWPCRATWEQTAIDCLAAAGCRLIASEVFECETIESLVERADALFALLPDPAQKIPLADTSPLLVR
jgi:hypothetical protein